MDTEFSDARHTALAVASRRRLLEVLRAADQPLDGAALAKSTALHVTTARFHLDVLERAGLVNRTVERAGRTGRPRHLYAAAEPAQSAPASGYSQLAAALVGVLAEEPGGGEQWADQAGRRWAVLELPAAREESFEEGTRQVAALFDTLGFAPRVVDDDAGRHIELDSCPFRELARAYPQLVCNVHAGLLRGALGRLGLRCAEQARLRPFVEPELCIADIPLSRSGRDRKERAWTG